MRHTFRTASDACKGSPAVRMITSRADPSIDARYRETIDVDRLEAVTDHVRQGLRLEWAGMVDTTRRRAAY